MQTNAVLRKRAFRLFWQHRGMLWMIYFLFALANLLWYSVRVFLIENDLPEIVYQLVTASVMVLGVYHLLLRVTRGGKVRLSMLFDFVKSSEAVPKVLAVCFIWQFPLFVAFLFSLAGMPVIHQKELAIFVLIVMIVAILLIIWIKLRLFLLPYLFVLNPQDSVPGMIKSSFRIMKGQVKHLIWYGITVYWWAFALFIGVSAFFYSLLIDNTPWSRLLIQLILSLFLALLNPYFGLAFAGYANEMLVSKKIMR